MENFPALVQHTHTYRAYIFWGFFFLVFINILVDWWSKLYNIGSGTHENPGAPTHPYWQNQYVLFRILGTECDVVEKHDGPYGGRTKWQLCRRHIYFNSQWHVVERLVLRLAALCLYTRFFFCVCGCHAALSHVRCVRWSVALVLSETDRASLHMAQYVSNVSVLCAMMDALAIVAEE